MSTNSKIEWTQATWNPVAGCTRVSAGCDHCYAVRQSYRLEKMGQQKYAGLTVLNGKGERHFNGVIHLDDEALTIPLKRKAPTVYFVNSMSDLFHRDVPFEFIDKVFAVMALCPVHTFQILTKRPERMAEYLNWFNSRQTIGDCDRVDRWGRAMAVIDGKPAGPRFIFNPLPNVWLGTSVENRALLTRTDELRKCPAAVHFLSLEPLLEDLKTIDLRGIEWVIIGGESGPHARSCGIDWIRNIIQRCRVARVPCFVKQLGSCRCTDVVTEVDEVPLPTGGTAKLGGHRVIAGVRGNKAVIDINGRIARIKLSPPTNGEPAAPLFGFKGKRARRDAKGGDMAEWPDDLRVREMPQLAAV